MIRRNLFLIIILFISSCNSSNTNKKFIEKINKELKENYNIENGNLIAVYDLAKINKKECIFAANYGAVINEERDNKLFLRKFKRSFKKVETLDNEAGRKILKIKNLVTKINNKYNFIGQFEFYNLTRLWDRDISKKNNINTLLKIDKIISYFPFMIPLSHNHITSNYGMRRHPIKKKRCFHCGIDLQGHKSTLIYSSAEGKVRKIGRTKTYGNFIEIEHSNKFRTKYAHLNKIFVQDGEKILRGQKIGLQGKTGNATGEHLHYEIWLNNKHIDPFDFIVHACKN